MALHTGQGEHNVSLAVISSMYPPTGKFHLGIGGAEEKEREKFNSITDISDSLNSSVSSQNTKERKKERTNENNQRRG
jgi:hypothetical protein